MATYVITGGTGMVGRYITNVLVQQNHEVIVLTRNPENKISTNRLTYAYWNPSENEIDNDIWKKADYVIHLAGAGVADKRWTKSRKLEIANSRIQGGELLAQSLQSNENHVQAFISASAIGWYGPDTATNKNGFVETDAVYDDFLGQTCLKWEESVAGIEKLGIRLVKLRIGIVLHPSGGALKEFVKPVKFGLATILGSGRQKISWIHLDDLSSMILYAAQNSHIHGVYNAVAPNPVSNKEMTLAIAKILRGNFYITVYAPSFALQLLLGEMSIEVLKSTTVSSKKIQAAGFSFSFGNLEAALKNLLKSS